MPPLPTYELVYQSDRGNKWYELSNHLGNVLVVVSDFVDGEDTDSDGQADYYAAGVVSASDYYPYGWVMPDRSVTAEYRYGYNGMEKDIEINQGSYGTYFRSLDARIGRWRSLDPVTHHWQTPYSSMNNNPVTLSDPKGDQASCCNFAKAAWNGFWEYGEQVYQNYKKSDSRLNRKTIKKILTNVDIADITLEVMDGFLNDAIPNSVKEVLKESIDVKYDSETKSMNFEVDLSYNNIKNGLISHGTNKVVDKGGKILNNVPKKLKSRQSSQKAAANQFDRSRRVYNNNPTKSRLKAAQDAKKKAFHTRMRAGINEGIEKVTSPIRIANNTQLGGTIVAGEAAVNIKDPLYKKTSIEPKSLTTIFEANFNIKLVDGLTYIYTKDGNQLYILPTGGLTNVQGYKNVTGEQPKEGNKATIEELENLYGKKYR